MKYEGDETPDLSQMDGHWDPRIVLWHGEGENRTRVAVGRRIARLPGRTWPNDPEKCTAESGDTTWLLNGRVLVCNGCGLDGT